MLLADLIFIVSTSPTVILSGSRRNSHAYFHNRYLRLFSSVVRFLVSSLAILGAAHLSIFACVGVILAIVLAFVHTLSVEMLLSVFWFGLVLYYCWNSYSSFTSKYQDLALAPALQTLQVLQEIKTKPSQRHDFEHRFTA